MAKGFSGRGLLGLMLVAGALLAVSSVVRGAWLQDPSVLPVRHVVLIGALRHQDPDELQRTISESLSGNMLNLDLASIERRLEQYPWIRQARIQRDWPSSLRVQMTEQKPLARWEAGGLLSVHGDHFFPNNATEPEGLLQVSGQTGREAVLAGYLVRLSDLLATQDLRLVRLEETPLHSLHLTLDSGLELILGRIRPFERLARWLRYHEAYARRALAHATIIDLRYPNGFAVRSSTKSREGTP